MLPPRTSATLQGSLETRPSPDLDSCRKREEGGKKKKGNQTEKQLDVHVSALHTCGRLQKLGRVHRVATPMPSFRSLKAAPLELPQQPV